jgi:VWFA-related protein
VSFEGRTLKGKKEEKEIKLPPQPKKKLVVIFDRINFEADWKLLLRQLRDMKAQSEQIIEELLSLIKLGNEAMICQLSSRKGFEIIQPYTTEEELIRKSVDMATGAVWHLGGEDSVAPNKEPGPEGITSQGDKSYLTKVVQMESLFRQRHDLEKTFEALLAAITFIKEDPGRKSILLISPGIPDIYLSGFTDIGENIRIFDPFNTLKKKDLQRAETILEEIIRLANSFNISIYCLEADVYVKTLFTGADVEVMNERGIYDKRRSEFMSYEKSSKGKKMNLRWISEATGADFLRGAKKLEHFRHVMRTDLNNYYLLSFYPARGEADGKYHKIEVNVKRQGVDVKHREGYTDYTQEGTHNLKLVSAFYNPSIFTQLPIKAELFPIFGDSGKCEPWMSIALPAKEFFIDRFVEFAPKTYELHIWIKDKLSGKKGSVGRIKLPFHIDEPFMEYIQTVDYVNMHFNGPELKLEPGEYEAVFALVDPITSEIGTCVSSFKLPNLGEKEEEAFLNCVLGEIETAQEQRRPLGLSSKDGLLEFGQLRLAPRISGIFDQREWVHIFLQFSIPDKEKSIQPKFFITGEDGQIRSLSSEVIIDSYNEETKIWSGIYFLDTDLVSFGEHTLTVQIPGSGEDPVLNKNLKLTILGR